MSAKEEKWHIITIDFDRVSIFESDRGSHEAQALGEVEGEIKGAKRAGNKFPSGKADGGRRIKAPRS